MTVALDKSQGGTELCDISFNMADFKFNEYKILRLYLNQCPQNTDIEIDPENTYLDIGLKGTMAKGLINSRSGAKSAYGGSGFNS